jgi:hypothetical protein
MSTPTCVSLRARFGSRYRVRCEESYYAEYGRGARVDDPWLQIIPCKWGHVFPHGGDLLAASVDGFPKVAGRLRRLACVEIWQDGDLGELTALFHVRDFGRVAQVMRPRRRRRLTETQRAKLVEAGAKTRFQAGVQDELAPQERVPGASGDPEAVEEERVAFER